MNTQQLEYILKIAEERSFSGAAEKLFITQPSLSQYVSKVEKQLGTLLFDRSTKPLSLTPSGEAYVASAKEILRMERELNEKIAEIENIEKGSLRIGAVEYHSSYLLPESVDAFHKKHPGISINIVEGEMGQLYEKLREGTIDLIIGSESVLPLEFDVEVLAEEKTYLAIPECFTEKSAFVSDKLEAEDIIYKTEKYLFADNIDLQSCPPMPFVLADKSEVGYNQLNDLYERLPIDESTTIHVSSATTAFSYTLANVGACLVTDSFICYGNIKKHPAYYALPDTISKLYICMMMRKQENLPNSIRAFGQVLKDLVAIGTWRRLGND